MNITTKDLNWDNGQNRFTSGSIIYGGETYKFVWNDTEYVINGKLISVFEKQLLQALRNEFKPK